jgi:acetyl-CoA C-acetyltransferase
VGVYSTAPARRTGFDSADLQAQIDAWPAPPAAAAETLEGVVETFTIDYGREPHPGVVICRTAAGERFVAAVEDPTLVDQMIAHDPLGAQVACRRDEKNRRVAVALG